MKTLRIFFPILLIALLGLSCSTHPELAQVTQLKLEERDEVKYVGEGSLEKRAGIYVLRLKGSPFMMGYQQGFLLRREIQQNVRRNIHYIMDRGRPDWVFASLKNIPEQYIEEAKGIAKGSGVRFEDLIGTDILQMGRIRSACSNFVALGKVTADGNLIHGRTFDWTVDEAFTNQVVIFRKPSNGSQFVGVAFPGSISVFSGVNSNMVSGAINMSFGEKGTLTDKSPNLPAEVFLRKIVQDSKDLENASKIAHSMNTRPTILIVADGTLNRALILEISLDFKRIRAPEDDYIICTNHYLTDLPKYQDKDMAGSFLRYEYYKNSIKKDYGKIDNLKAEELLRNYRENHVAYYKSIGSRSDVQHALIFQPAKKKLFITINRVTEFNFQEFDLKKDFNLRDRQL